MTSADGAPARAQLASADAPGRVPVDVAVGVLIDAAGRFLLCSRPAGKVYAGYWEFPGGKVEAGESIAAALQRELHEELGITIGPALPWQTLEIDYPHARVRLHFCKVHAWQGAFEMREAQQMAWQDLPVLVQPVLPGTVPVLAWLAAERGFGGATHGAGAAAAPSVAAAADAGWLEALKWDRDGLVPVIAQEQGSGDVLMFAWMDRAALALTAEQGRAVYYSRSRQRLWPKGEASGHVQRVHEIRIDCDADVVLLQVTQLGHEPGIACHTGRHSCFFQRLELQSAAAPGCPEPAPQRIWRSVDPVLKAAEDIYKPTETTR